MKVQKNTVVSIHYSLTDEKGTLLDSSDRGNPLEYVHGAGGIIPGLEKALEGKDAGEKFSVTVASEDAYGARDESLVQEIPVSQFQGMDEVKTGMQFEVQTSEGDRLVVTVTNVDEKNVTVDGNHPLAGVTLNFEVDIAGVRQATEEEVTKGHICSGCSSC